ncbi:MAG: DUF3313 domain-containing protein [Thiogranum sp.]|nr:DUF3313 domain-containing protein [Thiogranum sp.]
MKNIISRLLLIAGVLGLSLQYGPALASEFIEDMPPLAQDPDRAGAMIWEKPGVNRAQYTKVMLEPITIFVSPDSEYKGLSAEDLQALSQEFHETLAKTLEPEIPIVSQPGPDVLHLRAGLINVKLAKKKRGLLGYTPVGIVITAAKDAVGARVSLKDAALEIEALDSVSGERVGVLADKAPKVADTEDLSWDSISKTFEFYAQRFKARMQAAK